MISNPARRLTVDFLASTSQGILLLSSIIQSLFSTRKLLDACGLAEGIA